MSILTGDCLEVMKSFPDNHFSAVVTDPPYGLHFMGKDWDGLTPSSEYWREILRVTKPGGYILAFGGTRTYHRQACAIEDAGWEIRDCLMWLFGSGFPKSHNFGKKLEGWEGYGTALKPAYEPILLGMKPLDGTFIQNAEKWGVAGINIDECRIGNSKPECKNTSFDSWRNLEGRRDRQMPQQTYDSSQGRWPANLILDEEAGAMLDEQSGLLKSGKMNSMRHSAGKFSANVSKSLAIGHGDSGGASRFFYCAKTSSKERNEGLYNITKKSGGNKNASGRGFSESDPYKEVEYRNSHPTVKPLALMRYLLKLISPPKDALILDPFAGSGSTLVAARQLGIECVGIEKQEEYAAIAIARVNAAIPDEKGLFDVRIR